MRLITITVSLALGLIASLALTAGSAARPYDPAPRPPIVAVDTETCPSAKASAGVVPGGVYRAMIDELRQAGYSRAEIQAELGKVLVAPASGRRVAGVTCTQTP